MDARSTSPSVLLQHDGELADVARLLDALGARYVERLGACEVRERTASWDVVIATPRRILHFHKPPVGPTPTLIAVLEGDSRTLRSHLRRMRVDFIVRRPVHPAALRLLILHALYRGPERRRRDRVTIGANVRFRSGFIPHTATLTDLSLRGCRLLSRTAVSRGRSIRVLLPELAPLRKTLRVRGTVVRSGAATQADPGIHVMAVRFEDLSPRLASRLQAVLDAHRGGPAVASRSDPTDSSAGLDDVGIPKEVCAPPPEPEPIEEAFEEPVDTLDTEVGPADRRAVDRRSYEKRVVALGEEATRVLLGRDISTGGMRVDPNPDLEVGHRFKLALHCGTRSEPMVVDASVLRDDGESGLILRFDLDDDDRRERLSQLIENLPVRDGAGDEDAGMVVSEILAG